MLAFARIPLRIPAFIPLVLWILFQFVMFAAGGEDQISWACHIGGIIAGAVLVLVLRSRGVPLLDRADRDAALRSAVEQPSAVAADRTAQPAPRWGRASDSSRTEPIRARRILTREVAATTEAPFVWPRMARPEFPSGMSAFDNSERRAAAIARPTISSER